MALKEILLLGNTSLYKISEPISENELELFGPVIQDLHDTLLDFREQHQAGRAIAAPQIGVMRRLLYMYLDKPTVFINPQLVDKSDELIEVWDDCLCFPDLLVKVKRHKSCKILYKNIQWEDESMYLEDDLSELLQHEYDHLDGILAVSKAIDAQSFAFRSQRELIRRFK